MNTSGLKGRIEKLEQQHVPKFSYIIVPVADGETEEIARARTLRERGTLRGCVFMTALDLAL